MIRILSTLLRPDSGGARVLGIDVANDPAAVRARVSLTGQFSSVDEDLTGIENLVLLGRLVGLSRSRARGRAHELLEAFDLASAGERRVGTWSGGMRRRLDVAAGIVALPDLVFLDEPTTGLDPRGRNEVWAMVRALTERGTTVVLTTQYLDEADQLTDRLVVLDRGRVIAEGTPASLKASVGSGVLRVRVGEQGQREAAQRLLSHSLRTRIDVPSDPLTLTARVPDSDRAAAALAALTRSGIGVTHFALAQPSLDEVFLALTGHPAAVDDPRRDKSEVDAA